MKLVAAGLAMALFGTPAAAQVPASAPAPAVRAFLVALSVEDLDRAMGFYRDQLGFQLIERTDFPAYGSSLVFLERDGFRLELVRLDKSSARQAPDAANDASMRGLVKLGFAVAKVDELVGRLKAAGAKVDVAPFDDAKRGFRGAIVRDPDGNAVALYELRSISKSEAKPG